MSLQVKIIRSGNPLPEHLEQYKQYASVPDDSRDIILVKMLKSAMLLVQAYSDRAMLPCMIELRATDVESGECLKLYQGGAKVISGPDLDGHDLDYEQNGGSICLPRRAAAVVVVYKNDIITSESDVLMPVCWELATALYDGEDAKVQGEILKKVYGML